jgi:hypothetical protein
LQTGSARLERSLDGTQRADDRHVAAGSPHSRTSERNESIVE